MGFSVLTTGLHYATFKGSMSFWQGNCSHFCQVRLFIYPIERLTVV
jgi:hypothetical protein